MYDPAAGLSNLLQNVRDTRQAWDTSRMTNRANAQQSFNDRWQQYAQEAPLMNQRSSPLDVYGGVPNMSPERQAFMQDTRQFRYGQGGAIGAGMLSRFGMNSPLTGPGTTADIASSGPYMQVGGYGSPLTPLSPPRDPQAYMQAGANYQQQNLLIPPGNTALGGGMKENPDYGGPYLRRDSSGQLAYTSRAQALRDAGLTEQADALEAKQRGRTAALMERRKELGLPYDRATRREAREEKQSREMQLRQARSLARQNVSPLSSTGQSLAPELYQSMKAQRAGSPLSQTGGAANTISLAGPDGQTATLSLVDANEQITPLSREQARQASTAIISTSPLLQQAGLSIGSDGSLPSGGDLNGAVSSYLVSNPGTTLSDQDLLSVHQLAVQMGAQAKAVGLEEEFMPTSFAEQRYSGLWKELSTIPLQNSKARSDWWNKYSSAVSKYRKDMATPSPTESFFELPYPGY